MFVVSPAAILYDQNGNPVAISPNVAIPVGTKTILVAGTDGSDARVLSVDSSGRLAITDGGQSLTVDGTVTANQGSPATLEDAWPVAITDGTNVMPTGDDPTRAVFHKLTDGTDTAAIDGSGRVAVQNPPNLDVASSTLATQATLATLLTEAEFESRINTLGQKTSANSTPVVLASDQPAIPVTDNGGSLTVDNANLDAALSTLATQATVATLLTEAEFEARIGEVQATPTANTVLGRLKDIEDEVVARLGVLGQSTMSGSTPVVIASDQSDVDVAQGTAAALTGAWPVKVTDGTNTLPTGDAAARSVFTQISDGTTGAVAVKPSTTAAQTSDNSLVVGLSPNSPLPAGSNEVGAVAQGTPAALADYWPVRHTDGTNTLPTADVAARALYSKITDGTNTMPTGDAIARSVFSQISDGTTGPVAVKDASAAAVANDKSLVTAFSPNSPLPSGSNEVGLVGQGTAAAISDYWPVAVTDGTNLQPTGDTAARAIYGFVTDGTNTTAVKAASTAATATDPSLVTAFSPNSPLPTGSNEVGAVAQGTAAALSGAWPIQLTDGTNTMPTGDVVARSVFQQISDGTTGPVSVKAASTAAQATDLSLVTAFSPNSPLPVGTNEVGAVAQGTPAALADYWPVRHTDGTNTLPTADVEARALFAKVTDGTNTMPTGDAVARSVFHQISDGTTGPVAVKPASTAALAADPSLVTAFSPNSPLPSGTNEVGFVAQGTAAALADYWPVGVTDGTNMLPTADVAARALYAKVTDGTNTQPTGDVAARSIFTQVSDGTNGPVAVKAASTAALAADPSLVTAFSPNSPLPVGTNQIGKIEQGTAAPLAGRWPVQVTDGTNTMPTMDVAARSGYVRVTDGTNTQPTGDVNARAIWTQIGDGTTGPAAVIAGNASPLLTDKSLNVQISPNQDPIPTTVVPATSTPGTAQGKVLIGTAGTYSVVRSTTYVEQTTQAQRSIVSSSASDSSAGTGARQVKITYYDATCTGPFYETVTMNGTTAVNTVATDICFIERMDVVSVGSNSYNVGTLSLYTGTGATGTIFATIGVGNLVTGLGDNETLYAHHYVGATTETKVVSVITGVTSSAAGGGRQEAFLKYRNPTVATSPTLLYGDVVTNSQGNALVRPYGAPQTLTGPAVIVGFVIPVANNTTSYFGFDYADEPV